VSDLYLGLALFLLLNVGIGLARVLLGPTPADRMLAAQLFGTTGVAILLLLAEALETPAVRNVAFVFSLLAIIATVVFVRRSQPTAGDAAPGVLQEDLQ
jgi:multicomponent Na+:H+ antiporter subunit F